MPKVSFIGVGNMKCASTSIYKRLAAGTDMRSVSFMSALLSREKGESFKEKEARFFLTNGVLNYNKYDSMFPSKEGVCGEWTPFYISSDECLKNIKDYNKDMKILLSVRHPLKRMWSEFKKHHLLKRISFLKVIEQSRTSASKTNAEFNLHDFLVYNSMYYDQLIRLYKIFGEKNVMLIKFEDFISDQEAVITDIKKFVGISDVRKVFVRSEQHNKTYTSVDKSDYDEAIDFASELIHKDNESFRSLTGITYRI